MSVRRYKLNRATEIWFWLCATALAARQAAGWEIRESKDAPPENPILTCDDRASGCCSNTETVEHA